MSEFEKSSLIFSWILKQNVLSKKTMGLHLINSTDLDIDKKIPCWLYNSEIDLQVLKRFM